jgi:hypothetical protein
VIPTLLQEPTKLAALAASDGQTPTPATLTRLGKLIDPTEIGWAFGQWELRRRALAKFSRAREMLFTKDGLEMATPETTASFHASLFSGDGPLIDGSCGIGGDSLALSLGGPLEAYDIRAEALFCAAHNLAVHGRSATLREGSSLEADWEGKEVFFDPARRSEARGKGLGPEDCIPPLSTVLEKAIISRRAWVKLSPMFRDDVLESAGHRLIFVGHRGECAEALVEAGRDADPPSRMAALADLGVFLAAAPLPSQAHAPGDWVHVPHPCALRAHAHGSFGLEALGGPFGWLTGPRAAPNPWLTSFKVEWTGPWREKTALGELKGRRLASVKTRGIPEINTGEILKQLRRKATDKGGPEVELMIWREGEKLRALLGSRAEKGSAGPEEAGLLT